MKFTIVTVVFNDAMHIEETIMSVLNQTYKNFQYLIIDGASTDGTLEIIKTIEKNDPRVDLISEFDFGIYDAMNKGIVRSQGDFINFMNSGDIFAHNHVLKNAANILLMNPLVSILYGHVSIVSGSKIRCIKSSPKYKIRNFLPFCHQSVFARKDVLMENLFSLEYKYASDYNQFVLISKNKDILWLQADDIYSVVSEGGKADNHRFYTATEYLKIVRYHYGVINIPNWLLFLKVILSGPYNKVLTLLMRSNSMLFK